MAQVSDYRRIVRGVIEHYASFRPSAGDIDVEVVIDESAGHYELLHNGWANGYRIHGAVIHIDIRDGKIWIQHDGTEYGVANNLVEAGVPKEHIVLAFNPPEMRKYTDYAVA
jgi:ketopantoate reductase